MVGTSPNTAWPIDARIHPPEQVLLLNILVVCSLNVPYTISWAIDPQTWCAYETTSLMIYCMSAFKQLAGHAVQPIQGGPGLCALPCYLLAMGMHINLQIGLWTQTYMTSWSLPLTIGFWICWQHTTYLSFSIAIWATTLFAGTMAMAHGYGVSLPAAAVQ